MVNTYLCSQRKSERMGRWGPYVATNAEQSFHFEGKTFLYGKKDYKASLLILNQNLND